MTYKFIIKFKKYCVRYKQTLFSSNYQDTLNRNMRNMNEGVNRRQLILALCLLCSMILLLFINPQLLIVPCFLLVWLLPRIVTTKYSGAYATSNASKVSKKKIQQNRIKNCFLVGSHVYYNYYVRYYMSPIAF